MPRQNALRFAFARGARGYRAISRDSEFIHQFREMPAGFRRFLENLFAKRVRLKRFSPRRQRVTFHVDGSISALE